jgi:branched-chain amino acid transport system substrate-binding protein
MYCMSPGLYPDPGTFAFSSNVSTIDLVTAALRYFVVGGTRRIAIITAIDANGQDAERSFNAALARLHAESYVVAREHFNVTDLSVAAQMQHIAAANPQLVIAWSSGTPMGTLLRGLNEAGLGKLPILTTNANANHATLEQFAPLLPAGGLYFPLRLSEIPLDEITDAKTRQALQAYLAAMKAVGVDKPDESNDGCWDLGSIVVDAFRKLGTNATAEQLRAYISSQSGWTGIQGAYDFRAYPQRGLSQNAVVLTRWDPRRDAWVEVSKLGGAPLK